MSESDSEEVIRKGGDIVSSLGHSEKYRCRHCNETSIHGRYEWFDCPFCPNQYR